LTNSHYEHSRPTDDSVATWGVHLLLASFQRKVTPPLFFSYTMTETPSVSWIRMVDTLYTFYRKIIVKTCWNIF